MDNRTKLSFVLGYLFAMFLFLVIAMLVTSCRETQAPISTPSSYQLTATPNPIFMIPGQVDIVVIGGGSAPYSIVRRGDTSIADAHLEYGRLHVKAYRSGVGWFDITDDLGLGIVTVAVVVW